MVLQSTTCVFEKYLLTDYFLFHLLEQELLTQNHAQHLRAEMSYRHRGTYSAPVLYSDIVLRRGRGYPDRFLIIENPKFLLLPKGRETTHCPLGKCHLLRSTP